jgi:hypothetical protein
LIFPLRVKIANLIKIFLAKKNLFAYQIDAEAMWMEPLFAVIARNHVLSLWLLANAKEFKWRQWISNGQESLSGWRGESTRHTEDNETVGICNL